MKDVFREGIQKILEMVQASSDENLTIESTMPQKNYLAWEVKVKDFYDQKTISDQLRFLVRFAVLAPSSHNSQPWMFEVGEGRIVIRPDMRRAPISLNENLTPRYNSAQAKKSRAKIAREVCQEFWAVDIGILYQVEVGEKAVVQIVWNCAILTGQ